MFILNRNGFIISHPKRPKDDQQVRYTDARFDLFSENAKNEITLFYQSMEKGNFGDKCKDLDDKSIICLAVFKLKVEYIRYIS